MNERPAAPRPMMEKSAVGLFFMYAIKYPAKQATQKISRILFWDRLSWDNIFWMDELLINKVEK